MQAQLAGLAEFALVVMGDVQMYFIGQALHLALDQWFIHVDKGQVNIRRTTQHEAFF